MSVIDKMVVEVGADIRPLTQGLSGAVSQVDGTNKKIMSSLSSMGTAIKGLVAAYGVHEIYSFTKGAMDSADAMLDLSQVVGITTNSLQELRYAATDSGMDVSQLDSALIKFTNNLGDAANGTGGLASTLDRLGVGLKNADGSGRSVDQMLSALAEKIMAASTEQERLAIATDAFGKDAAPGMVRVLSEGAAGLEKFRTEAQNLGVVIESDTLVRAKQINEEFDRMTYMIGTRAKGAVLGFINALADIPEMDDPIHRFIHGSDDLDSSMTKLLRARNNLNDAYAKDPQNTQLKDQIDSINKVIALNRQVFLEQVNGIKQVQSAAASGASSGPTAISAVPATASRSTASRTVVSGQQTYHHQLLATTTATEKVTEATKKAKGAVEELADASSNMGENLAQSFGQAIIRGGSLKSVLSDLLMQLSEMSMKSAVGSLFGGSGGSDIVGSLVSGIFGTTKAKGKATGGPVLSGMPYVVGENGREMFVPSSNGKIIPAGQTAAMGGVTVVQNLSFSSTSPQSVRAEVMKMLPQLKQASVSAMVEAQARGAV